MHRPWFRGKEYGWGWYPATWQGWLVMLLWLGAVIWIFLGIDADSRSVSDTLREFLLPLAASVAVLFLICWTMGEHPQWRWGGKPASAPKLLTWALVVGGLALAAAVTVALLIE